MPRRPDRRGDGTGGRSRLRLGPCPDQPRRGRSEATAALLARGPDREGQPDHDEDRADRPAGVRHRLVRARPRLETGGSADRLRRECRDPEGDLDRRQRADRGGFAVPVPRQPVVQQDVHVRGPPDLLGRLRRRLDGPRELRLALAHGRGQGVARGRRQLDARDRRARRRRRRARGRDRRPALSQWRPLARMTSRRRALTILLPLAAALAWPAAAWAHAALLRTVPSASGIVNSPPRQVALTYSEAVEPRFAIVSVTNAAGAQETTGPPRRSAADADTLVVPLRKLAEGWYLVYWRVISVDGHPVRGAFTFAVGPNPGPAPQFVIPSISETAATPRLLIARWLTFLSVMAAVGIFVLRVLIGRPVVRRVGGTSLRPLTIA